MLGKFLLKYFTYIVNIPVDCKVVREAFYCLLELGVTSLFPSEGKCVCCPCTSANSFCAPARAASCSLLKRL